MLPALQLSRPRLSDALREGGRSGQVGMARQRARTVLLVAEVALAVVLLIGAGLFVTSFVKLTRVDLGIQTSNVLTVSVYGKVDFSSPNRDQEMARAMQQVNQVFARVRALPGVVSGAIVSNGSVPMSTGWSRTSLEIPGQPKSDDPDDSADVKGISPDYFKTVRIPVVAGREFSDADMAAGAEPVIIINTFAADRFFKGKNPIGEIVKSNGTRRIVGVVGSVRLQGPEAKLRPEIFTPMDAAKGTGGTILLRTSRDAAGLSTEVRNVIHDVMPNIIVPETQTFDQMYDKLIVQRKFNMIMLAIFGALAIVIAAVGIYGVMAYIVEQRTQEIGVRMALGAEPGQVMRMVLSRATLFMTAGVVIGLAAGWGLARFVAAFLFEVEPHSAAVYAGAAAVLIASGLIAAAIPAHRAAKVDPLTALR
jgi:putative ABC transport system permease protein